MRSPAPRLFMLLPALFWLTSVLATSTPVLQASPLPPAERTAESTITNVGIFPIAGNGTTDIAVAVCADSPQFQLRSEQAGVFLSEIFARSTGCPTGVHNSWRAVVGAVPGETFTIFLWASDQLPNETGFMQRAARYTVTVTGHGSISTQRQPHAAPSGSLDSPAQGARLSGTVTGSGWALDAASWNGPGVDQAEVWVNGVRNGPAGYGQQRNDIAAAFGDPRFAASGFSFQLDTTKLTNGPAQIEVRYRSSATGQLSTLSRSVTIANATVGDIVDPPSPPVDPEAWPVPYFAQGNPNWGGQVMRSCGLQIAGYGCALTSLSMLFAYYGASHDPKTLNTCLGNAACHLQWSSPVVRSCSGNKIAWVGWPALSGSAAVYARLEQELKTRPVILELRNPRGYLHFVVALKGSGTNPANYVVHDPGIRQGTRTSLANTLRIFPGYQPAGLRIYTGTPAVSAAEIAAHTTPEPLRAPELAAGEQITGSIALYRNTETAMVLELAAQSSAGAVTAMRVWTESRPSEIWQPFAPYVQVPIDSVYYVQFRDAAGNLTPPLSAQAVTAPPTIEERLAVFLPLVRR